jgi:hypothetical protein
VEEEERWEWRGLDGRMAAALFVCSCFFLLNSHQSIRYALAHNQKHVQ